MQVDPRVFGCGWEAVAVWPWLCSLGEEFDTCWVEPETLERVLGIPQDVCDKAVQALTSAELLCIAGERCSRMRATRYSYEGRSPEYACAGEHTHDTGVHDAPTRVLAHTHEAELLESCLRSTWESAKLGKTDDWVAYVCGVYPELDLVHEAKSAKAWELANPSKTKQNVKRYLNNWFKRAHDKATKRNIDSGTGHWSNLSRNERRLNMVEGREMFDTKHASGVMLSRSLKDDLYVLCVDDLMDGRLPFRKEITALQIERLRRHEDVHDHTKVVALLKHLGARADSTRTLTKIIDETSIDAREREGLLPV